MGYVKALEPFSYVDRTGVPRVVPAGEVIDEADPAVKGREKLFGPLGVRAVETASAAPGEVRTRRPLGRKSTED